MKILVIGGCGFIGSHVVDRLVGAGISTTVLDHRHEPFRQPVANVVYHHGRWQDPNTIATVLAGGFACVVHLGWSTTPASSNLDPSQDAHDNVVGTLRLLDACVASKVARMVFASSGGTVYGPSTRLPLSELQPTEPISSYGIAKLAVEKYLQLYQRNHGITPVILRVANPYGPRQDPRRSQGAVAVFAQRILTGTPIEIWGDGSVIRDYLYVADVAEAFVLAVTGARHGICNIGSGVGLALTDLIHAIERQTSIHATITHKPSRNVDIPAVVLDRTHAAALLGWSPRTSFADGLGLTIDWLRHHQRAAAP